MALNEESSLPERAVAPAARGLGPRAVRVIVLWVAMIALFVVLWNWVGPGSRP